MKNSIAKAIEESIAAQQALLQDEAIHELIGQAAVIMIESLKNGGKIMIAGNGGSAADAQHMAGEFVNRFNFDRPPLPGIALSTDTSVITAISNDYEYNLIFVKQVEALGRAGDVFVGISTSGNAPNIINALKTCAERKIKTIGLTGRTGGEMAALCDCCLCVPSDQTPVVQESHIMIEHIICGLVEDAMFPGHEHLNV